MRTWPVLVAIALCLVGGVWLVFQPKAATGPTIRWRDAGWASVTGGFDSVTRWNRGVFLKNDGDRVCAGQVYCFAGNNPDALWLHKVCTEASDGIELSPGEVVSTGVWLSEVPNGKIHAVIFLSSASDLRSRLAFRTRYPFLKALRPLPLKIVEMPE
jgi:hypothetical protein